MKSKLLVAALGALILGTSTLAFADRDHTFSGNRSWGDRGRGDDDLRHRYHGPRDYRPDHWHHRHHGHSFAPRWHRHWERVPPRGYYRHSAPHYGHGRDGVSIILRGHFN